MRHFSPSDYRTMPWKNGGGATMELYVSAEPGMDFDWRVSIATVDRDGPFSRFPGYDRHIMTISGEGMSLEGGPDGPIDVYPAFVPRRFSGDWTITGRLRGESARDFNLIVRRDKFRSELDCVLMTEAQTQSAGAGWIFYYVVSGAVKLDDNCVMADEALLMEPGETGLMVALDGPARLVCCRLNSLRAS